MGRKCTLSDIERDLKELEKERQMGKCQDLCHAPENSGVDPTW